MPISLELFPVHFSLSVGRIFSGINTFFLLAILPLSAPAQEIFSDGFEDIPPELIKLCEYLNDDGLFKTFDVYKPDTPPPVFTRTDDRTVPGKYIITFFEDGEPGWVLETTYYDCEFDSCFQTGGQSPKDDYKGKITDTKRTALVAGDWDAVLPLPSAFSFYEEDRVEDFDCRDQQDDCEEGRVSIVPKAETARFYGKTTFDNGIVSYDDCILSQWVGGGDFIWNSVLCRGVGTVRGWHFGKEEGVENENTALPMYHMEFQSVTGTRTECAENASAVLSRLMKPSLQRGHGVRSHIAHIAPWGHRKGFGIKVFH